jgi:DNA-binding response OmpR family regulator
MGQPARLLESEQYTIVLDPLNTLANTVSQATDTDTKWFETFSDLVSDYKEAAFSALALFVNINIIKIEPKIILNLKEMFPVSPIFVLTEATSDDLTEALALGADDFLLTPLEPSILKLRFLVRKTAMAKKASRDTVSVADITVDSLARTVTGPRGSKFFSTIEIRLITLLAQNFNKVVTREALKGYGWPNVEVTDNALNRKLYEIRLRINNLSAGINIRTLYGVGFVLEKTSLLE